LFERMVKGGAARTDNERNQVFLKKAEWDTRVGVVSKGMVVEGLKKGCALGFCVG